ncbi:ankyrin [Aspergillus welwitschiae]|uniref:Ankyrin n=1 Tax=Aspergillus welwitschiae TaxID=1341132 RepID=A0A3F3PV15_9EURO|nr:ankyrin [Aspergillus welwitschiae]RDH30763.1 ankyrin [Aspergillus welwitschiae]
MYLSFDDFRTGCSRYWGHHAPHASPQTKQQALEYLQHESLIHAASQAMLVTRKHPWNSDFNNRLPSTMTRLHLTAYFGLMEQLMALLETKYSPGAARNEHDTVPKLLCKKDGVDPDCLDSNDRTPVALFAMHGTRGSSSLLLGKRNVKPDSKINEGRTPLSLVARNGHEKAVKELIQNVQAKLNVQGT